jgi:hypothetical protein
LQTESERDEQKGFIQILQGLYTGIRNPRSHEHIDDIKNTADPIIYFIDYLCKVLDSSRAPFVMSDFLLRVFDRDFVENERYAELLVDEIPSPQKVDVLIQMYRGRGDGETKKLRYVSEEILKRLSDSELDLFLNVVSEELNTVSTNKEIISTFQIIPDNYWLKIKESAKMRIENKLINSIKVGEVILNSDKLRDGHLGTWAIGLAEYFSLKSELKDVLSKKLQDADIEDNLYVFYYFFSVLPSIFTSKTTIEEIIDVMHKVIVAGDEGMKSRLYNFLYYCPKEWEDGILEKFQDLTDIQNPEFYLPNGTPFLGKKLETPPDEFVPF